MEALLNSCGLDAKSGRKVSGKRNDGPNVMNQKFWMKLLEIFKICVSTDI
jgi:hypothetical protein